MRTYLNVPYSQKDAARRLGALWDGSRWYVENVQRMDRFMRWMPAHLMKPARTPAQGKGYQLPKKTDREKRKEEAEIRRQRAEATRIPRKKKAPRHRRQ